MRSKKMKYHTENKAPAAKKATSHSNAPFVSHKEVPAEIYDKEIFANMYTTNPVGYLYFYVPLFLVLTIYSLAVLAISIFTYFAYVAAAIGFWTVFEYVMHRYFFHWQPTNKWGKQFIYSLHKAHHEYPNDNRLLLVSWLLSFPSFLMLYGLFYVLLGSVNVNPFMAGMVACYIAYDWLHYASHNYNFKNSLFQKLKRHHMMHHFQDKEKNYGFTSTLWDKILNTFLK